MPRGVGCQGMKIRSLRTLHNRESDLLDRISPKHAIGIHNMANSIVELRDLIFTLRDFERNLLFHEEECNCATDKDCRVTMDAVLDEVGNIVAFFLSRMHHSDSHLIEKMCPKIFLRQMSRESLKNAFAHFSNCIDSMCAVNCTVIESALQRQIIF